MKIIKLTIIWGMALIIAFVPGLFPGPGQMGAAAETAPPTMVFGDVSNYDPVYPYIAYLQGQHIIEGCLDGDFHPHDSLTRAQAAAIAVRGLDIPAASDSSVLSADSRPFPDVSSDYWALPYINAACNAGFIKGMPDGSFQPERPISRAEAVTLLLGAFNKPSYADIDSQVADLPGGYWARNEVITAVAAGMLLCRSPQDADPDTSISRQDMARALAVIITSDPNHYTCDLEGIVSACEGEAEMVRSGQSSALQSGAAIRAGDVILTGSGGRVVIDYPDGSSILLLADSELEITESTGRQVICKDGGVLPEVEMLRCSLKKGRLFAGIHSWEKVPDLDESRWFNARLVPRTRAVVESAAGQLDIKGTYILTETGSSGNFYSINGGVFAVLSGSAAVSTNGYSADLGQGQQAVPGSSSSFPFAIGPWGDGIQGLILQNWGWIELTETNMNSLPGTFESGFLGSQPLSLDWNSNLLQGPANSPPDSSPSGDSSSNSTILPDVSMSKPANFSGTSTQASGVVTYEGSSAVTERGFVLASHSTPDLSDLRVAAGSGPGAYTATLAGLLPNTDYYVRPYAISAAGTAYGNTCVFTSIPTGSGTAGDPYQISTAGHLDMLRGGIVPGMDMSKCYQLVNDLDLSAYTDVNYPLQGWLPLGWISGNSSSAVCTAFTGNFDGQHHTVSGLSINNDISHAGLFAKLDTSSVSNLKISGASVQAGNDSAILAGEAYGAVVSGCQISVSSISNKSPSSGVSTGLLIGKVTITGMSAAIERCSASGSVTGTGYNGGLVGTMIGGSIRDCYTNATVSGSSYAGGLIGQVGAANIDRCYACGNISGSQYIGGIAGSMGTSTYLRNCAALMNSLSCASGLSQGRITGETLPGVGIVNNYALDAMRVNGSTVSGPTVTVNGIDGAGVTAATAMTQVFYAATSDPPKFGWDFADVWDIVEGTAYPFLRE